MKVTRTITQFVSDIKNFDHEKLQKIKSNLESNGFTVQTLRVCHAGDFLQAEDISQDVMVSVGEKDFNYIDQNFHSFINSRDNLNMELADTEIELKHIDLLFRIISENPSKTFNFTYVFNNAPSSPYMPSANYEEDGFAIGLQPNDLAKDTSDLKIWFKRMEETYDEIIELMNGFDDFLGIDSSIAPLFEGDSSLINFVNKNFSNFTESVTSDFYTRITDFIKNKNPKPIGLCGLMIPCLEDFELAREYKKGEFSIERNIFLSLHSGLGIDVYPIGMDQDRKKVLQILKLIQALSNKYQKPLSARFVSDGKAKIGDKSDFGNQYLYDVEIQSL